MTPAHESELRLMQGLAAVEGVRSYLEVGARNGISFEAMARALPPGSRLVAVDLPGGAWGSENSAAALDRVADMLRRSGYDVHLIFGDSTDPEIVEQARALGPYDMAFIDGDHRYDGVRSDWRHYGPIAGLVVFDDIWSGSVDKGTGEAVHCEVGRLWSEIRGDHRWIELAGDKARSHGKGVIWR